MPTVSNNVTLVSCDLKCNYIHSPLTQKLYLLKYLYSKNIYLLCTNMRYIVPFIRDLLYNYVNIPEYLSLFIYYFYKMPRLSIVTFFNHILYFFSNIDLTCS